MKQDSNVRTPNLFCFHSYMNIFLIRAQSICDFGNRKKKHAGEVSHIKKRKEHNYTYV